MVVPNDLVEATVATKANGSTARKGTELSSRGAHLAVDWALHTSGRSTTTSTACARRSGTGQGEVPRRAGHALAGRFAAGHPLCASHIPAKTRIHGGWAPDTFARHRRHHRHVRGNQQWSAKAAVLPGTGQAGQFARIHRSLRRALGLFQS